MKDNKNRVTKEMILENTLKLIDENDGIKDVTLRDIARKTGCAHTNLYNYFSSLDDIFWEALGKVLLMMMEYSAKGINDSTDPKEALDLLLSNLIDFSIDYPGWYKLIWSESIGGSPSAEVIEIMQAPGKEFIGLLMEASNNEISEEKANFIGNVLHGYLHGEVSKWIYKRSFLSSKEEAKRMIFSNIKELYKKLTT